MRQNTKRAVSFVLVLVLLMTMSAGVSFADSTVSGTLTGSQGHIDTITRMGIDPDDPQGMVLVVEGTFTPPANLAAGAQIKMEFYYAQGGLVGSGNQTISKAELEAGKNDFSIKFVIPEDPVNPGSQKMDDGGYYMYLWDGRRGGQNDNTYQIYFNVDNNNVDSGWEDEAQAYELTITPSAVEIEDAVYGSTMPSVTVDLQNTGVKELTSVELEVSGSGFEITPAAPLDSLTSGAVATYTLTVADGLTPGAYTVDLLATGTGEADGDTVDAATASIEILKAENPGTLPSFTTTSATTVGGVGKIEGLEGDTVYDLLSVDEDGPYTTWTSITANALGVIEVTPGSFQMRLPETDFYLPSDPSEEFLVKAFYHLMGNTFDELEAGVYQEIDLNDYLSGGTGSKTFAITAGALPAGLTLDGSTGIITGTPSAVTSVSITATIEVTDSDEGKKSADFVFAKVVKGSQPTPGALSLSSTDHVISILDGKENQWYFVTTASALTTTSGLDWTTATAIKDLKRNTKYYVYSKYGETNLLKESPISSGTGIYTKKTTIAAVSVTRSAVDSATLGAIVTPTDAAVDFVWFSDGVELSGVTGPVIEVKDEYNGTEITVVATGKGDFQGALTSSGIVIGGVTVKLKVTSWNPARPVEAVLFSTGDHPTTCTALSATGTGIGATVQAITIENVKPDQTYRLILKKDGFTDVNVTNVAVSTTDLEFSDSINTKLTMHGGDFNHDNSIRLEDRALLLQSKFYGKSVDSFNGADLAEAELLDIDGNGWIDFMDLCILMGAQNFGMDAERVDASI